jgi:flagellar basal body-associated protein FliL
MEEGFQDKDKKKKIHFILWILRLVLILIIVVLVTTLTVPFLRRKNLWEINLWKWVLLILFVACDGLISN